MNATQKNNDSLKTNEDFSARIAEGRTGQAPTRALSSTASAVLLNKAERYGLDTRATAELIASVSTVMETSRIQTTSDLVRTLMPTLERLQALGGTVSEKFDLAATLLNEVDGRNSWHITRDRGGRTRLHVVPLYRRNTQL